MRQGLDGQTRAQRKDELIPNCISTFILLYNAKSCEIVA